MAAGTVSGSSAVRFWHVCTHAFSCSGTVELLFGHLAHRSILTLPHTHGTHATPDPLPSIGSSSLPPAGSGGLLERMAACQPDIISLDQSVDFADGVKRCGNTFAFQVGLRVPWGRDGGYGTC